MSASEQTFTLSVETADRITEIAVYDGNLNVVAKGIGKLVALLPSGLYRVRIRVSSAADEKLVALDRDQSLSFGEVSFSSPIPLPETQRTHEYHIAAAGDAASLLTPKKLGTGASIMIFAREWSPQENQSQTNPAEGLSLLDSQENLLAEIWKEADLRNKGDASAGWRADVDPGGYFLRLELDDADKTVLLRPIYVSPTHQLQVFCLVSDHAVQENANRAVVRRADLARAAIAISLTNSFDPQDRSMRLSELACSALTQSRGMLTQSLIDELMEQKFNNPVLGLFAAHLLLKNSPEDRSLFRTVTDNLLPMLGPDHPDLQALWWQRDDGKQIGDGRLHVLPMLSASWSLAVDRSIKTFDVFSFGTFLKKLTRIIPSVPWMMLMDNEWAVSDDAIDDYMKARAKAQVSRAEAIAALRAEAFRKHYFKRVYSSVREMLPTSVSSLLPDLKKDMVGAPTAGGVGLPGSAATGSEEVAPPLQGDEKAELARSLSIPAEVLETILNRKGH
jgi:hypothetical protein